MKGDPASSTLLASAWLREVASASMPAMAPSGWAWLTPPPLLPLGRSALCSHAPGGWRFERPRGLAADALEEVGHGRPGRPQRAPDQAVLPLPIEVGHVPGHRCSKRSEPQPAHPSAGSSSLPPWHLMSRLVVLGSHARWTVHLRGKGGMMALCVPFSLRHPQVRALQHGRHPSINPFA